MPNRAKKISDALLRSKLKSVFGLAQFRDAQDEVIHSVLAARPVLAVMPTGAGKSLCYQLPAVLLEGTCVVISPLISLMRDQRAKLKRLGIDAVALHSGLSADETKKAERAFKRGPKVLFTTPERLANKEFFAQLKRLNISLFVIDEAHCLSQWGHDFRPDYLTLPETWRALGEPRLLALTATATEDVIEDLRKRFALPKLNIIYSGVYRPNLRYGAFVLESEDEKLAKLRSLITLKGTKRGGIVYCATVKSVDEVHEALTAEGVAAVKYHGKLPMRERHEAQRAFMSGAAPLIIATNAFGMGIDRADVRFVIHYQFAGSLEAYYQESGRAGRDGKPADCTLLYLKSDKRTQNFFLLGKYPNAAELQTVYDTVKANPATSLADLQEVIPSLGKAKVKTIATALREAKLLKAARGAKLSLSGQPRSKAALAAVARDYLAKHGHDEDKLKAMIMYAQSALCRWKILLEYFGQDEAPEKCGRCDNCRRKRVRASVSPLRNTRVESTQLPELV